MIQLSVLHLPQNLFSHKNCFSDLELGELLHDDVFGLFEAMSAIEMMDPKMDAGMMCNRGKKVLNFDQAVKVCVYHVMVDVCAVDID